MAPRLVANALERIDDQDRRVGLCRAGDHVAKEFGMAGSVDQNNIA